MIRQTALGCMAILLFVASTMAQTLTPPRSAPSGEDFLKALLFAQLFAKPEALKPENDLRLKTTILNALQEKPPVLSWAEVKDTFDPKEFASWANEDEVLSLARIDVLLKDVLPPLRPNMHRDLGTHLQLLTTQFDMIDAPHRQVANELAGWIAKNYSFQNQLNVSVICTGNSRRSMLGSVMGNIAAEYWNLPNLKFHSGGTAPTAFNPRTIEALKKIGIQVSSTDQEAPHGTPSANFIYRIRWGSSNGIQEYSKHYADAKFLQKDFAAILVCDEADEACPTVKGASIRIAAPYFDPKAFDNTALEAAKYAERRDDIGRLMLCALMQASRQIRAADTK